MNFEFKVLFKMYYNLNVSKSKKHKQKIFKIIFLSKNVTAITNFDRLPTIFFFQLKLNGKNILIIVYGIAQLINYRKILNKCKICKKKIRNQ